MPEPSALPEPPGPARESPLDLPDLPVTVEEVLTALDEGRSARLDPEQVQPHPRVPG